MFEERDQACRNRNELFRRHVHIMNAIRLDFDEVALVAARNLRHCVMTFAINRCVGLGHDVILFLVGRQIIHLVRHAPVFDFAVRRLDESKFIDPRIKTHRADQTDVRAFRCFNRANPPVMRRVNVTDFEARAFA